MFDPVCFPISLAMGPKPAGPHWLWQAGGRQEIRRLEHPAVGRMSSSVDEPQAAVALRTPAEAAEDSTASLADQTKPSHYAFSCFVGAAAGID